MDDAQLVEKVARDFLDWHGAGAVNVLRDRAEQASVEGDPVSEQAWRDIANAAARITAAGSG
jgi:hypothetical protein